MKPPRSKSSALRLLLADGPATCEELAAELGWTKRDAWVAMWVLTTNANVEVVGTVERTAWTGRPSKLWALTPRGRAMLRTDRKGKQ